MVRLSVGDFHWISDGLVAHEPMLADYGAELGPTRG